MAYNTGKATLTLFAGLCLADERKEEEEDYALKSFFVIKVKKTTGTN